MAIKGSRARGHYEHPIGKLSKAANTSCVNYKREPRIARVIKLFLAGACELTWDCGSSPFEV